MRRFAITVLTIGVFAVALGAAFAQDNAKPRNSTDQPSYSYVPELAELMTITQTRHRKLLYAPETNNWDLASYEAAHLRKSFDVAVKFYQVFRDIQQAKLITDVTVPALDEIDKAIKARDLSAFMRSFEVVTKACNSCHQQAKVGFVKILKPYQPATGAQPTEPIPERSPRGLRR